MKKTTYLFGVASGVAMASAWRFLFKESVKAGVRAGRVIRRVSAQAMEEMEDANAEALDELAQQDRKSEK